MPTLGDLAALVGGTLHGPASLEINGVGPVESAGPGQITFVTDERRLPALAASRAAAVLLSDTAGAGGRPAIRHPRPLEALPALLGAFAPAAPPPAEPADRTAWVHPTAVLGRNVRLGPHAVVDAAARVGDEAELGPGAVVGWQATVGRGTRVGANAVIGERCVLGDRVLVHPGAVIGADGFGFAPSPTGPVKIPQIGRVVIGDDVEIGANATVDRGTVGDTVIRRGAKVDDQVHIGHNCDIGEGTVIAGHSGISGSVTLGRGARIGGGVGIADHVTLGDGVEVGARSGVHRDAPAGARLFGYPARDAAEAIRLAAEVARLPRLVDRVRKLEARLAALEKKPQGG